MLRFVKAQFPHSQKHYDYICDIDNIQKGDLVFVMTQYGKKLVTVRGIFYSEFEDMPLPGYAYKRILEKFVPEPPPNDDEPYEEEAEDEDDSDDEELEGNGDDDEEEAEGDDDSDDEELEGNGNNDGDKEDAEVGSNGEREQEKQAVRVSRPEDNKLAEERRRLQNDESGLRIVLLLLPAVVFIYLLYRYAFS